MTVALARTDQIGIYFEVRRKNDLLIDSMLVVRESKGRWMPPRFLE